MSLVAAILLSTLVAWLLLAPLLQKETAGAPSEPSKQLSLLTEDKHRMIQMLRDLELDFATSKLSEQEYNILKQNISSELASVLQELDKFGTH